MQTLGQIQIKIDKLQEEINVLQLQQEELLMSQLWSRVSNEDKIAVTEEINKNNKQSARWILEESFDRKEARVLVNWRLRTTN